jgi:hypothetical protein
MSASFLGISCNFYNFETCEPQHILLNVHRISHPHTGEMIADKIESTLKAWNIQKSKVLLIITDNGRNMQKAIRKIQQTPNGEEQYQEENNNVEVNSEEFEAGLQVQDNENVSSDDDEVLDLDINNIEEGATDDILRAETEDNEENVVVSGIHGLSCLAHTLQLIVKDGLKIAEVQSLLAKCRAVVRKVRMSSVATEKLLQKCKKMLINDVPTRWNSTFLMIQRLLQVRADVTSVFTNLAWDGLQPSEWVRLEDLQSLLAPFASHTDMLQSDSMSLSSVIPALLDLQCHLQNTNFHKKIAREMLSSLTKRSAKLLDPDCDDFEVVPAVACFADPTMAPCLLSANGQAVYGAAKQFFITYCKQV